MNQDVAFRRKVIYIAAIAALLYPLFRIGQPASVTASGEKNPGGILAQLRAKHNLSQAELGEIDPASESMKLATLGLRGVAANLLWEKANEYKTKEDWDNLSVTLNQITKLQPNFISVWDFQAHNLTYNVSVEFDDYRQRYHWVKKGISFLIEGTHYNRDNPPLLHQLGWYLGQKMGRADEHVQFRELFREDEDFHKELSKGVVVDEGHGYDGRPDNWLVGRQWYLRAERAVAKGMPLGTLEINSLVLRVQSMGDAKGMQPKSKSPLIFHADAPMSLLNYASDIEDEGILGQVAQRAWADGGRAWAEYGRLPITTSWGHNIRLGDYKQTQDEITRLRKKLDEMAAGVREKLLQEKLAKLPQEMRAALDIPDTEWSEATNALKGQARARTQISHEEVAQRAPQDVRDSAIKVAARLTDQELLSWRISHYRSIINYDYWETRCDAEQTAEAVEARELLFNAKKAQNIVDLDAARRDYEKAWVKWKIVFDKFPRMKSDVTMDELVDDIKRYQSLLQSLDEELPDDFVLRDFLMEKKASMLPPKKKKAGGAAPATTPPAAQPSDKNGAAKPAEPAPDKPAAGSPPVAPSEKSPPPSQPDPKPAAPGKPPETAS